MFWLFAVVISVVVIVALVFSFQLKCPACHKPLALKETQREDSGFEHYSKLETRLRRVGNGMQSYSVDIPYIRYNQQVTYTCKYCGYSTIKQDFREQEQ
jgi:C4-type Zn-finger protein